MEEGEWVDLSGEDIQASDNTDSTLLDYSSQVALDINTETMTPETLFESLEPELKQMFSQAGITSTLMNKVLGETPDAQARLSQMLSELGGIQNSGQLTHHKAIKNIFRIMSFFGGAINRVTAYAGLTALFSLWGAPVVLAEAMAGTITAGALMSSNFLAVEGINHIQFEGLHSIKDTCCALVAGAATAIDCGMAYKGMVSLTGSTLAGVCAVPFMAVGLFPLLLNKLIDLSFRVYGESAADETLSNNTVQLLAEVMQSMALKGCTMSSSLGDRLEIYFSTLGLNAEQSYLERFLTALSLHSKPSRHKNTLKTLQTQGFLSQSQQDHRWTLPERVYHQARDSRQTTAGTRANNALLLLSLGPSLFYVFGDTTSLTQLVQDELSIQASCGNPTEQLVYWLYQGGTLAAMSGKTAAAANNGAKNMERLYLWLRNINSKEGEPTTKSDVVATLTGFVASLFYGANNYGTLAGNLMETNCLGSHSAALYILPTASAVGAIGFNGGCGKQLKHGITDTLRDIIQTWSSQKCGEKIPDNSVSALFQLHQNRLIDLSSITSREEMELFLHSEHINAAYGDSLYTMLQDERNDDDPSISISDTSDSTYQSITNLKLWLLGQELPEECTLLFSDDDHGHLNSNDQTITTYLHHLSTEIIRQRLLITAIKNVGDLSFYATFIKAFPDDVRFQRMNAQQFKQHVTNLVIHLLGDNQKNLKEQWILQIFERWRLLQIARDLKANIASTMVIQLISAIEQKNYQFIMNNQGYPVVYRTQYQDPLHLTSQTMDTLCSAPIFIDNGAGHWSLVTFPEQVAIQID